MQSYHHVAATDRPQATDELEDMFQLYVDWAAPMDWDTIYIWQHLALLASTALNQVNRGHELGLQWLAESWPLKDVKQALLQVPKWDRKHGAVDVGILRPLGIHLTLAALPLQQIGLTCDLGISCKIGAPYSTLTGRHIWPSANPQRVSALEVLASMAGVTPENCRPRIWVYCVFFLYFPASRIDLYQISRPKPSQIALKWQLPQWLVLFLRSWWGFKEVPWLSRLEQNRTMDSNVPAWVRDSSFDYIVVWDDFSGFSPLASGNPPSPKLRMWMVSQFWLAGRSNTVNQWPARDQIEYWLNHQIFVLLRLPITPTKDAQGLPASESEKI
jgi:hypothetical protein